MELVFDLSAEKLDMAKETGSARSREHVDTHHLESMTPERTYVTRLNAALHSVYTLVARMIATQRMDVSIEAFEATGIHEVER